MKVSKSCFVKEERHTSKGTIVENEMDENENNTDCQDWEAWME